jgi:hypothetical protein
MLTQAGGREEDGMIEALPGEKTKPRTTEKLEPPRAVAAEPSGGVYAWFLKLPAALVVAVMWLMGVALLVVCGAALYLAGTVLA